MLTSLHATLSLKKLAISVLVSIALPSACTADARPPPADHVVPVWYLGVPVVWRSFEIGKGYMTEAEIPAKLPWPQHISYIVGVADLSIGASPHQSIPAGPGGSMVTMPGHQAVITCMGTPDRPVLGVAYAVLPGPSATVHNLRSDVMPDGSLVGAPLATAVRIGPSWVPLTSHVPIEWGLRMDVLRLRFFGANPTGWATANWDDNYPPMPLDVPCTSPPRAQPRHVMPAAPMPRH